MGKERALSFFFLSSLPSLLSPECRPLQGTSSWHQWKLQAQGRGQPQQLQGSPCHQPLPVAQCRFGFPWLVSLLSARPNSQEQLLSRQGLYYLVRYSNVRKAVFPSTAETSKAPEVNCPSFSRVPKWHFRAQEFTSPRRSSLELTRLHTKGLSSSRDLQTLHTQGSSPGCLF